MKGAHQGRNKNRSGVGNGVVVAIIIASVIVASGAYYLGYAGTTASTTTLLTTTTATTVLTTTQTTSSTNSSTMGTGTTISATIPSGVGTNQSLSYQPANMTVVIGVNNTIVWTNQDSTPHTVTSTLVPSQASSFDSGIMSPGDTFRVTLTVPGTYQYYCTLHPDWMKATVVVKS